MPAKFERSKHHTIHFLRLIFILTIPAGVIPALSGPLPPSPSFSPTPRGNKPYLYRLQEELPAGTIVANIKEDAGFSMSGENLTFVAVPPSNPDHKNLFNVNSQTGVVRTAGSIDRDLICPRALICTVDLGIGIQPARIFQVVRMSVEILDLNDNSPRFPSTRRVESLGEDTTPGFFFHVTPAEDRDSPGYGIVRYELIGGRGDGAGGGGGGAGGSTPFQLEVQRQEDGTLEPRLLLATPLDREQQSLYHLKVVAYDGGTPPRSGSFVIDVSVKDVNDNAPEFNSPSYEIEIMENTPPKPYLLILGAVDADEGENARVTYTLSPSSLASHGDTFSVDPRTGVIASLRPIDYEEEKQKQPQDETGRLVKILEVIVTDSGDVPRSTTARVRITVLDVNDNPPEIILDLPHSIPGAISPKLPLPGGATSSGRQGAPTPPHPGIVKVMENCVPGTFVLHLSVNDRDSGTNGRVSCTISQADESVAFFTLQDVFDNEFKIVTTGVAIDREVASMHRLTILCTDAGVPSLSSSLSVDVEVDDVNDNWPKFEYPTYNLSLWENNRVGWTVGWVKAGDDDDGKNGEVVYSIIWNSDTDTDHSAAVSPALLIDPRTGVITANARFCRNTQDTLLFFALATDRGNPALSSSVPVTVHILEGDDDQFSPVTLRPPNVFRVAENQPPRTPIGRLVVTPLGGQNTVVGKRGVRETRSRAGRGEAGSGEWGRREGSLAERRYYRLEGERSEDFIIVNDSVVVTTKELDRELHHVYQLNVIVSASAENSQQPSQESQFSQRQQHQQQQETPQQWKNAAAFPRRVDVRRSSAVNVNSRRNDINVKMSNDMKPDDVIVASVIIHVIDLNDNAPVIVGWQEGAGWGDEGSATKVIGRGSSVGEGRVNWRGSDVVHVTSDSPTDYHVMRVIATDEDSGANAKLVYELVKDEGEVMGEGSGKAEGKRRGISPRLEKNADVGIWVGDSRSGVARRKGVIGGSNLRAMDASDFGPPVTTGSANSGRGQLSKDSDRRMGTVAASTGARIKSREVEVDRKRGAPGHNEAGNMDTNGGRGTVTERTDVRQMETGRELVKERAAVGKKFKQGGTAGVIGLFVIDADTGDVFVNGSLADLEGSVRLPVRVSDRGWPSLSTVSILSVHVEQPLSLVTPSGEDVKWEKLNFAGSGGERGGERVVGDYSYQVVVTLVIGGVTFVVVILLLVAIVVCRRRRRQGSIDVTAATTTTSSSSSSSSSRSTKSAKSDVTLVDRQGDAMSSSSTQRISSSGGMGEMRRVRCSSLLVDDPLEMCDCRSVLDELTYLDVDTGHFVRNNSSSLPSPLSHTPVITHSLTHTPLGMTSLSRGIIRPMTDDSDMTSLPHGGVLRPIKDECDSIPSRDQILFSDWLNNSPTGSTRYRQQQQPLQQPQQQQLGLQQQPLLISDASLSPQLFGRQFPLVDTPSLSGSPRFCPRGYNPGDDPLYASALWRMRARAHAAAAAGGVGGAGMSTLGLSPSPLRTSQLFFCSPPGSASYDSPDGSFRFNATNSNQTQ